MVEPRRVELLLLAYQASILTIVLRLVMVELMGFEPTTSSLQGKSSPIEIQPHTKQNGREI